MNKKITKKEKSKEKRTDLGRMNHFCGSQRPAGHRDQGGRGILCERVTPWYPPWLHPRTQGWGSRACPVLQGGPCRKGCHTAVGQPGQEGVKKPHSPTLFSSPQPGVGGCCPLPWLCPSIPWVSPTQGALWGGGTDPSPRGTGVFLVSPNRRRSPPLPQCPPLQPQYPCPPVALSQFPSPAQSQPQPTSPSGLVPFRSCAGAKEPKAPCLCLSFPQEEALGDRGSCYCLKSGEMPPKMLISSHLNFFGI